MSTAVSAFFFQAEDGIRDTSVTGVQTCALPILTKGARKPAADAVKVTVTGDGKASGPGWDPLVAAITGARAQLLRCWEQHGQGGTLSVPFRFRNRFQQGEYEDSDRFVLSMQDAPGGAAAARACGAGVLAPFVSEYGGKSGFDTVATVSLGP